MNWGKSIVLAFVLFTVFIATLVTLCVCEDVSLVTKDYYREELVYQRQIERITHAAMLDTVPHMSIEEGYLLKLSYIDLSRIQWGTLELFRPSDPNLDRRFQFKGTDKQFAIFSTAGMAKGMYRARLRWAMNGEEFYVEQVVHL